MYPSGTRRVIALGMVLAALLAAGAGCHRGSAIDLLGTSTWQADARADSAAASALERQYGGVTSDAVAEHRAAQACRRLSAASTLAESLRCRVLASDAVNAFSLPGGRVYITRGLYRRLADDGLLLAVVAHELAHLEREDSLKPPARDAAESMDRELAADARAAELLRAAGVPSGAMVRLLAEIGDQIPAEALASRQEEAVTASAAPG